MQIGYRTPCLFISIAISICYIFFQSLAFAGEDQYEYLRPAVDAYNQGNKQKAIEEFQKALHDHPEDQYVPFYIGLLYLRLNEPAPAIEYFKKTLEKEPDHADSLFNIGVALTQTKDFTEALRYLEQVYKKEPERDNLGYFLGLACFQLQQYNKALYYFEKAKTKDKNIEAVTGLYSNIAKQQLEQAKNTGQSDEHTVTIDESLLSAEQVNILQQLLGIDNKKRFNIEVTAKAQYDDNVNLLPEIDFFRTGEKNTKSIVEILSLQGEYFFAKLPSYDISASYNFEQTIVNSIRSADTQSHILSFDFLKKGWLNRMPYNLQLTYSYEYLLLDNRGFYQHHALRPVFFLIERPEHLSVLQYTFLIKQFNEKPFFTADNRNAINHEIGLVHFLRFDNTRHYIKAGYFHDEELAKGDNWDYSGNKFIAGGQYTFPFRLKFNVDYEYKSIRYENDSILSIIFAGEKRRDIEKSLTVTLLKDISKQLDFSIEYFRRHNASNVMLYEFEKNLFSAALKYKF